MQVLKHSTPDIADTLKRVLWLLVVLLASERMLRAETPQPEEAAVLPGLIGAWYGNAEYEELKGLDPLRATSPNWTRSQDGRGGRGEEWSARWEGYLTAPTSGRVSFHLTADYLAALTVGEKRIFASKGAFLDTEPVQRSHSIVLEQGRRYPLRLRYAHRGGERVLRVLWSWEGESPSPIPPEYLSHSKSQAEKWQKLLQNPGSSSAGISRGNLPQPLTDWASWPQGYSVLLNEKAMFPVEMTFWKAKIDARRQLFIDNNLLAGMSNLSREFHAVEKHAANPVFDDYTHGGYIWRDPNGGYRLYYNQYKLIEGDTVVQAVRLAVSDDGVHWRKPHLDLPLEFAEKPQTGTIRIFTEEHVGEHNNVLIPLAMLHGVYYQPDEPDPDERWKAVVRDYSVGYTRWEAPFLETRDFSFKGGGLEAPVRDDKDQSSVVVFGVNKIYTSPDGLQWTAKDEILPQLKTGRFILDLPAGNNFPLAIGAALRTRWDPYLKKYVAHTKHVIGPDWRFDPVLKGRAQGMMESDDLVHWSSPRIIVYPDSVDAKTAGMYGVYESDGFCYESRWLGCLSMIAYRPQRPGGPPEKEHWIRLAGSRDGRHWYYLGDREPFIPAGSQGEWDTHYMRMANLATTGGPVDMGDELWFYYWGRGQGQSFPEHHLKLGIGRLRKDGFASLNAGDEEGAVATRPLCFAGEGRLYVNLDATPGGYVKAAILDEHGDPIAGYSVEDCLPAEGDRTRVALSWEAGETLAPLKDQHVRIVFYLKQARFYSFWIE